LRLVNVLGLVALAISATTAFGASDPSITFNPSIYDYGNIPPDSFASKTFVLTSGKRATGMLTVSLTGSPTFWMTADSCTGTRLGANKSCSVTVQYAPTIPGTSDSASLFAVSSKPLLNAFATLTGGLSPGCALVSSTQFQGTYISAGMTDSFKAGETLTMLSGEPTTGGTPAEVILNVNSGVVDTVAFPGTVEYTIPEDGQYAIGWGTNTNTVITTWAASCVGPVGP
jgi:hypothetical protein